MDWCRSLLDCTLALALPLRPLVQLHHLHQRLWYPHLRHPRLVKLRQPPNQARLLFLPARQRVRRRLPAQPVRAHLAQAQEIMSVSAASPATMDTALLLVLAHQLAPQFLLRPQMVGLGTHCQAKIVTTQDSVPSRALMATVHLRPAPLQARRRRLPVALQPPLLAKFALQVQGREIMLVSATSAATTATAPQVHALVRLLEHQYQPLLLLELMGFHWRGRIVVTWGYVALLVIMGIALQPRAHLIKATDGFLHFR